MSTAADRERPGRGLEVDRLSAHYGDLVAVDDVTLSVAPGEVT